MPKYLFQVNYVGDGVKGLLKEGGGKRRDAAEQAAKSLGGTFDLGISLGANFKL